jgi:uncharacterized protein (TIGR02246 family)
MDQIDNKRIVVQFNQAINTQDLDGLVALMTEDHAFIDSSGASEQGREAMRSAWKGFFGAYPDYRNVFEQIETKGDSVVIRGHSICSNEPALDGPAIWAATLRGGLISEWRVYAESEDTWAQLIGEATDE